MYYYIVTTYTKLFLLLNSIANRLGNYGLIKK